MTAPITNAEDVVTYLKRQHQQIKGMAGRVQQAQGSERREAFDDLRRLLAVHESAEELVVHPRAKKEIPGGTQVVGHLLEEENEAKHALSDLEDMDVESTAFEIAFDRFCQDVLHHAQEEERGELNALQLEIDEQGLRRMRRAAELAEATAPTHPHPGVGESRAANVLAGPFVSMVDRARDLINSD